MSNQERKVYSFKSVGETKPERDKRAQDRTLDLPIGIKTPMRLSAGNFALFDMHTDLASQIRDNFRNMVATNHGERLSIYDFGGNLLPLAFELGADDVDSQAIRRITATTEKYMPFISLETFEPFRENSEDGNLAKIGVRVTYSIPSIQVTNQAVEALIYAVG